MGMFLTRWSEEGSIKSSPAILRGKLMNVCMKIWYERIYPSSSASARPLQNSDASSIHLHVFGLQNLNPGPSYCKLSAFITVQWITPQSFVPIHPAATEIFHRISVDLWQERYDSSSGDLKCQILTPRSDLILIQITCHVKINPSPVCVRVSSVNRRRSRPFQLV